MRALLLLAVLTAGCVDPDRTSTSGFCATGAMPAKRRMLGFIVEVPAPPGDGQQQLRFLFQEAKNAIRAQNYGDAQRLLQRLANADPNFGGGTVAQYVLRVEQELRNERHLRAAEQLVSSDPAAAQKALERVEADTLQTVRKERIAGLVAEQLAVRRAAERQLVKGRR